MQTVHSKDGTKIAFEQRGAGPALILVGGSFEYRAFETETAKLAAFPQLAEHFTVISYDRRGRGDSGDTQPYAVEREIEDIEALIDYAGGKAFLSGISSGAGLALEAALALGSKVQKLAMYEAPYNDDPTARAAWRNFRQEVSQVLAEGRRDDAVGLYMMLMGLPEEHLPGMRELPFWPMLEAVAPTVAYEGAVLGEEAAVPSERAAQLSIPVLLLDGEASQHGFIHTSMQALAEAIPNAEYRTLAGQTHEVEPEALAPALVTFFK